MKWSRITLYGAVIAAAGLAAHRVLAALGENKIALSVVETVHLPAATSNSFVEVALPVDGQLRMECNLLVTAKFLCKMNCVGARRERVTFRREPACSDMVEAEGIHEGVIRFTPPRAHNAVLLEYEAESREDMVIPVSIQECVVQAASMGPNSHQLRFELVIFREVADVTLTIIFPKNAHVAEVNFDGVGTCRKAAYSSTEYLWEIGCFFDDRPAGEMQNSQQLTDDTMVGVAEPPSQPLGRTLKTISFTAVYLGQQPELPPRTLNRAQRRAAEKNAKRSRESGSPTRGDSGEEDLLFSPDSLIPGLCISYTTFDTASGLRVNKLQTLEARERAPPLSFLGDQAQRISKKVRYTTHYIQQIQATPKY